MDDGLTVEPEVTHALEEEAENARKELGGEWMFLLLMKPIGSIQ